MPRYVPPHLRKKCATISELVPKKLESPQKIDSPLIEEGKESVNTKFGECKVIYVDETNPCGEKAKYLVQNPRFSQAFLHARRRQKEGLVEIFWILDKDGKTLEIGAPEDWKPDIAIKIKTLEARVTVLRCGRKRSQPRKMHKYDSVKESGDNLFMPLRRRTEKNEKVLPSFTTNIQYSCLSEKGQLDYQEDRYTYIKDFHKLLPAYKKSKNNSDIPQQTYIGVFDGHGGTLCAQEASDELHKIIAENMGGKGGDCCEALRKAFLQFDAQFKESAQKDRNTSGSVACCVIIEDRTLYVANIGDCAAVLCRGGDAILLSDEHPPKNQEERERIEKAGGTVSMDGRLNGDLAVSRAFGDLIFSDLKVKSDKVDQSPTVPPTPSQHEGVKAKGLTAMPVIKKHYLCDEDEFLIVACDGVFDYIDYKNSVQTVRRNLRRYNDVERANNRLVQFAAAVPSMDNMTAVLVGFPKTDKDGKRVIVKPHSFTSKKPKTRFQWKKLKDIVETT